ncbi:Dna2-domain-containing protein [Gyrodon lividus]|nr:Dna2-domain-containing protein [Gyrodon lividus]
MEISKPSTREEEDFLDNLLSGLDSSKSTGNTSRPAESPLKHKRRASCTDIQPVSQENYDSNDTDLSMLLDGAESWDWGDMEADFMTPKKNKSSPKKRSPSKPRQSPVKSTRRTCSLASGNVRKQDVDMDMSALLDGAENWDWEDMANDFLTPKKNGDKAKSTIAPAKIYTRTPCTRCIVEVVEDSSRFGSKVLSVKSQPHGHPRSVILRDDWAESDIRKGDIINVLGNFDSEGSVTISSQENLLIHHPDLLLTATALSNAPQCRRKPLLSSLVRSTSDVTPALVWGNMLHEVMQTCLAAHQWDEKYVDELIDDIVLKNLAEIVKIGTGMDEAKREVKLRSKGLRVFSERYIAETPKPDAVLTNTRAAVNQNSLLAITALHDVEEDIWSPTYGLKGKLDASVQAVISESTIDKSVKKEPLLSTHTMPFEIKTGRSIAGMEHRAQTMLYTLLAEERYGVEVPSGLLYYTQSEEVMRVPRGKNELRGLINARNDMAAHMMRRVNQGKAPEPFLPPTIDDERVCKKCYALDTCMLYRKAVENVEDDSSPIAGIYELKTSHLTPAQTDFFKQWEALIALEEQDGIRFKKELWTMGAQEREDKGRCFNSMVIDASYIASEGPNTGKINRYAHRFVKAADPVVRDHSLLNGHMSVGDAITVSVDPELLALARGFILNLTPQEVVVGLDHDLNVDRIAARLQVLRRSKVLVQPVFRIDKDELSGGMGRIRDNLAQLFYADGDTKRLELAVDLRKPTFEDEQVTLDALRRVPEYLAVTIQLNPSQLAAMTRVLSANDYALILGMPGTGKTTVIAALIRTFVGMGKTVLLTSYTHSAVDTILLKLKDDDYGILRLGNVDKVHPDVREFTQAGRRTATTIEQLESQLMSPPVVATTCLTIDQKGGLETSLFRRLSEAHPHAVVDLTYQYRMNEDIMLLSNKLIYGDRLRCGSEAVAKRTLVLPDRSFVDELRGVGGCLCDDGKCWLARLLDESCKAVFVDTDRVPAFDSRVGDLVQNDVEGKFVYQITEALLQSGIEQRQICIMSLYRQQIKLLSHLLQDKKDIEILTADKSQGRDKDCVIISMVRSNDHGQVGDLLKDWRRVNVSFTRAQSKLIVVGSRKTLESIQLLAEFLGLMNERGWMLTLPGGAENLHPTLEPPEFLPRCTAKRGNRDGYETGTPPKKARTPPVRDGLLKGRPILKDVLNGDQ